MSKQNVIIATTLLLVVFGIIAVLIASQGSGVKSAKETDAEKELSVNQNGKELNVKKTPTLNIKSNLFMDKGEIKPLEYEVDTYVTKYVNVSSLNVRKGPSVDYEVVGLIVQNQNINAEAGNGQNGWLKVKTNEFIGFVNEQYLSDEPVKVSEERVHTETLTQNTPQDEQDLEETREKKSSNENVSKTKEETETSNSKEETVFEEPKEETEFEEIIEEAESEEPIEEIESEETIEEKEKENGADADKLETVDGIN